MQQSDSAVRNTPIDFTNFVEHADYKINAKMPEVQAAANGLAIAINRVSALLTYDFDANVHRPRGSSWASYRVLFALWVAGPLPPQKAGEIIGMGKSAVSNLTKALIKNRLIAQVPSPSDGRSILLSLTPDGEEYLKETLREQNKVETLWANALTQVEQHMLVDILNKLLDGHQALKVREQRQ